MKCKQLSLKDPREFYLLLEEQRDPDLIKTMVECIIDAHKNDKTNVDVFDITFENGIGLVFGINKSQYKTFLSNCIEDMIEIEEFELCSEIKKIIK
jgi:hypothetical protein